MNDDFTPLTYDQVLPLVVCEERRRRYTETEFSSPLRPPLPPCPTCETEPTEMVELPLDFAPTKLRVVFRPCGHRFSAAENVVMEAWTTARVLVDRQENRPAGQRVEAPCPSWSREEEHDAHDWFAPVDGPARCPGWTRTGGDEGQAEQGPEPSIEERLRDTERIIQRVREAVATDQPAASADAHVAELVHKTLGIDWSAGPQDVAGALLTACRELENSQVAREQLRADRNEARMWARHGYEIGQRHCGWTDHGVAPKWLTEGWPPHFDSCEHLKHAADLDTALTRVRALPDRPQAMDPTKPHSADYLLGYRHAMNAVHRAVDNLRTEARP